MSKGSAGFGWPEVVVTLVVLFVLLSIVDQIWFNERLLPPVWYSLDKLFDGLSKLIPDIG